MLLLTGKLNPLNQDQWSTHEAIQSYCQNPDIKILFLLEHEGQVKDCLGLLNGIKGQKQIIALSPFAIYELDRQRIPYKMPEDYYDPHELYQLGMDNYQKVEAFCSLIDNSIHKTCPIIEEQGIKPALFNFFRLKIIYDAATVRLFQLFELINAEKPNVIFIYDSKNYPFGISEKAPYLIFDNRESVYAHLLKLPGWKIPVVILPNVQHLEKYYAQRKSYQSTAREFRDRVIRWLVPHPELYDLTVAVQKKQWGSLFMGLKGYLTGNKNMPVLLLAPGYNWDHCRRELQSVGIGPIIKMQDDIGHIGHWLSEPFSEMVASENLLDSWEELRADNKFRKFFRWEDIDFFPVVEERLQFLVERLTLACLKAYVKTSELLKNRGIKAVLASTLSTCIRNSAAQAAHSAGIPVITWQHGGNSHFDYSMLTYNDLMNSDVHFFFGEGGVQRYTDIAKRFGTRLMAIGSASLDILSAKVQLAEGKNSIKLGSEKKVVLYVITTFYQNNLHVSFSPVSSDNRYWYTQRAIIDCLARHTNYMVIVKVHPNPIYRETPLKTYAWQNRLSNCQFIRDESPFTDLLLKADVLVIDSPTTTLLQALTTSKPIFVYTGHLHIDNQAQKLLERRACCHGDLKDFVDTLEKFLSGDSINNKDLNDKEFQKRYGIYKGASGVRAAKELNVIIKSYSLISQRGKANGQ